MISYPKKATHAKSNAVVLVSMMIKVSLCLIESLVVIFMGKVFQLGTNTRASRECVKASACDSRSCLVYREEHEDRNGKLIFALLACFAIQLFFMIPRPIF